MRVVDLTSDIHGHVLDFVSDMDRRHFEEYPDHSRYYRREVEHEVCSIVGECVAKAGRIIVVVNAGKGRRLRSIAGYEA